MDYPGNFETPAFPAGRRIAVSRIMAILTLVAFVLVIFLCGILLWSAHSDRLVPYMISINNETGQWHIVGRSAGTVEYSTARTMQESVVGNFVYNWFRISADGDDNTNAWRTCDRATCGFGDEFMFGAHDCVLYCASSDDLYSRFAYDIMPEYESRAADGQRWELDKKTLLISPAGKISEQGGTWSVTGTVYSDTDESFEIRAFLKIAFSKNYYPQTTGFYVADFNAYRIN